MYRGSVLGLRFLLVPSTLQMWIRAAFKLARMTLAFAMMAAGLIPYKGLLCHSIVVQASSVPLRFPPALCSGIASDLDEEGTCRNQECAVRKWPSVDPHFSPKT